MGLTPGTKITVSRIAPLKGPVEINIRGCKLALGNRIADNIFVEAPEK
jgi:DtxR family Mn-dependent transcriptional regulator